jgi:hypothetical protein
MELLNGFVASLYSTKLKIAFACYLASVLAWSTCQVLRLSNRHQSTSDAACPTFKASFSIGNHVWHVVWLVSFTVRTCAYRAVLIVQYASQPLLNCNSDVPTLYVLPMKKHELGLVSSTCAMSCNAILHDCTRHTHVIITTFSPPRSPRHTYLLAHARHATSSAHKLTRTLVEQHGGRSPTCHGARRSRDDIPHNTHHRRHLGDYIWRRTPPRVCPHLLHKHSPHVHGHAICYPQTPPSTLPQQHSHDSLSLHPCRDPIGVPEIRPTPLA